MRKMTAIAMVTALILVALVAVVPVTAEDPPAQPQLPHTFFGKVIIGDNPAGPGLIVEAAGPGVRSKIPGNPVTTLSGGLYGIEGATSQRLIVQGSVTPGTPVDFYVGAQHAEVYDVSAGGPWKANYTFAPGGYTELNLRIASLPAAGQTREPTPAQTPLPLSAGSSGPILPQLPGSPGLQPVSEGSQQSPVSAGQAGTTGQEENPPSENPVSGGQGSTAPPPVPSITPQMTLFIAGGIMLLLIGIGGAYYYTRQKNSGTDQKEEPERKE